MTNADEEYLQLMLKIQRDGISKTDRTGTGTKSLFAQQMRFDLSNNKIPLLTTKKMFVKGIIHELLWFLSGNTSSNELEKHKVNIWSNWKDENGELGKIYGHQWRSWEQYPNKVVFPPIKTINKNTLNFDSPIFPPQQPMLDQTDNFIGNIYDTINNGQVKVLRKHTVDPKHGDHAYDVQFIDTGFVKKNVRKSIIGRGYIKDLFRKRVSGIGYLGHYDKSDIQLKQLQRHWYKILERCYNPDTLEYCLYGGSGIFVHPDWHCFATFQKDVKQIPNWNNKRLHPTLYELDKDYFQSNCYSKETCVWLTSKHNCLYRTNPTPFTITDPDGNTFVRLSVPDVAVEFDLTVPLIYRCLANKQEQHKGFTFTHLPNSKNARYALPIDQIAEAIHKLRNNPHDRRIIVTAWNVGDIEDMRLPPCHAFIQFWVDDDDGLYCHLYQRSADLFLGVPFNIAQYSILTHMIAHVTGLHAKEFVWTGGDVHIYNNHVEQCKLQLENSAYPSPTIQLSDDCSEIDNFNFDDFVLLNYEHHDAIKAPVSI